MIFTTKIFFIFIVLLIIPYIFLRKENHRQILLLAGSLFFYGFWDIRFLGLLILQVLLAYYTAVIIKKNQRKKIVLAIGLSSMLIILGYFKYFNFFLDSFVKIFKLNPGSLKIILPIGISFYSFQAISFLIDIYKKDINEIPSLFDVMLYITFFPQLVAGPIVRASDFIPQLRKQHKITWNNLYIGFQIFIFGLIKKIVIADHIAIFVDEIFDNPIIFSSNTIILAIISYAIQIYLDFSGYSDMAIGIAKIFNFDLCRNFNVPYLSNSITEFWRRWHISLSTWLRDYLYIPLGGNRKGLGKTYLNLIITMALGGLWHGANIKFIIWGLLHGLALSIDKFNKNILKVKIPNILGFILTNLFVLLCWIPFRADSISTSIIIFKKVLFINSEGIKHNFSYAYIAIIAIIITHILALFNNKEGYYPFQSFKKIKGWMFIFSEIMIVVLYAFTGINPFIYFQF